MANSRWLFKKIHLDKTQGGQKDLFFCIDRGLCFHCLEAYLPACPSFCLRKKLFSFFLCSQKCLTLGQ